MAGGSLADEDYIPELTASVEHGLLNHLVVPQQRRLRDRQAEGFGGFEVDDQIELRGLLDRDVCRFGPFQNLVHLTGGTTA